MKVDVAIFRDGEVIASEKRMDFEKAVNRIPGLLYGYTESPEDFIAIRLSKRQVDEHVD